MVRRSDSKKEKSTRKSSVSLTGFLRARREIISNDCSTNLHNVDSKNEKERSSSQNLS